MRSRVNASECSSVWLERRVVDPKARGSNPLTRTMKIDHSLTERVCTAHCGRLLSVEEYEWVDKEHTRRRGDCKACQYDKHVLRLNSNRDHYLHQQRINNISHKYSLSYSEWLEIFNRQDGKCMICFEPIDIRSAIDHDHSCCKGNRSCGACVRGILHVQCNVGLANFRESIPRLQAAITYLEKGMEPSKS